jgi:dethiobiotin synthetase
VSLAILVSGNDTGIGKTVASAFLAHRLSSVGSTCYVKPIETGSTEPLDATYVNARNESLEVHTLLNFRQPLAPVEAAKMDGKELDFSELVSSTRSCSEKSENLVIEGAGGLATPIDKKGLDWLDFAKKLPVDYLILVVENRLGVLNQTRLLASHLGDCAIPCGLWLNEICSLDAITRSANEQGLSREILPIWAMQRHGDLDSVEAGFPWEQA